MSSEANCACLRGASLAAAVSNALAGSENEPGLFPLPALQAARPAALRRRRLWDIPVRHHCVLLGAAFDARELRGLFRRAGYADWRTASSYELHSSAVCFAKQRNDFSAVAQRALEDRFAPAVNRVARARSGAELLQIWRSLAEQGEAVGAYWAALTHPAWDADADEALSREMHMIAHEEFAARRATLRRVRALEDRVAELVDKQAVALAAADALRKENAELREAERAAQAGQAGAVAELARWRSGDMASAIGAGRAQLETSLEASRAETAAARRALRQAERRIEELKAGAAGNEDAVLRRHAADAPALVADRAPPPDLGGRRVLCVGGKTFLMPHYRAVIEDANGEFLYHDGGIEDSVGRLPAMLASADAVICLAADCSHAAYRFSKRYCKAKGKTCALLGKSSVTALSRCVGSFRNLHQRAVPAECQPCRDQKGEAVHGTISTHAAGAGARRTGTSGARAADAAS